MSILEGSEAAVGLTGLAGGASFLQAQERNAAISQSMQSAAQATNVKAGQIAQQGANAKQQQAERARQVRGRIRVASAAAGGTATQGSTRALDSSAGLTAGQNVANLERNTANAQLANRSQFAAQVASLQGQTVDPFLSAVQTGIQTGISLL